MVTYLVLTLITSRRTEQSAPSKIFTEITCINKDFSIKREFSEGDYVGKVIGKCPKCGSDLIIIAIYQEKVVSKEKHLKL